MPPRCWLTIYSACPDGLVWGQNANNNVLFLSFVVFPEIYHIRMCCHTFLHLSLAFYSTLIPSPAFSPNNWRNLFGGGLLLHLSLKLILDLDMAYNFGFRLQWRFHLIKWCRAFFQLNFKSHHFQKLGLCLKNFILYVWLIFGDFCLGVLVFKCYKFCI